MIHDEIHYLLNERQNVVTFVATFVKLKKDEMNEKKSFSKLPIKATTITASPK